MMHTKISIEENLSGDKFFKQYVKNQQPVLIKGVTKEWPALQLWDLDYFEKVGKDTKVNIKVGKVDEGNVAQTTIGDYTRQLRTYEEEIKQGKAVPRPPYLHDVPIFHMIPELQKDISPFPLDFFPKWYWSKYYNFIQFFMSGTNSVTPLHFDTLCTNNLFFQVKGEKTFTMIDSKHLDSCYIKDWRWSKVNPLKPDLKSYPLFEKAELLEVTVGAGDILYIPPYMLHHVQTLSNSISFNIDWHTPKSAVKGIMSAFKGAPKTNIYYNTLIALGLWFKIPSNLIFRYYKTYLNYIS